MKASFHTVYGPPEVLQIKEVSKPIPKDNEVLIKLKASTVNRTDTGFREAEYFAVRIVSGLFKPKYHVLGSELSGVIEAIGKDVKTFKVGDSVFGLKCMSFGAHAEYICVAEQGSIALKPENISYEEAAASSEGPWYALTGLKKMKLKKGDKILVNGGTGSIGSAAIQLANYLGAEVTAVANTKNIDLVKSLGAIEVIDYTKLDFTEILKENYFDYIFDAVGKSSYFKCKKLLKSGGIYYSTELGYMSQNIFLALFTPIFRGKKVIFPIPKDTKEDILFFKKLIEEGKYKAVIDRSFSLEEIVEATKYVQKKEKTGNVVIRIS